MLADGEDVDSPDEEPRLVAAIGQGMGDLISDWRWGADGHSADYVWAVLCD